MPFWSTPPEAKIWKEHFQLLFTSHLLATHSFLENFPFYLRERTEHDLHAHCRLSFAENLAQSSTMNSMQRSFRGPDFPVTQRMSKI